MENMLASLSKRWGLVFLIILFPFILLAYALRIGWMLSVFATLGVTKALGDILNSFKK